MYWLYGAWISFVLIVRKSCIQCTRGGGDRGPRDHKGAAAQSGPTAKAIDLQMSSSRLINGGLMKAVVGLKCRNNLGPRFTPSFFDFLYHQFPGRIIAPPQMACVIEVDCDVHQYVNKVVGAGVHQSWDGGGCLLKLAFIWRVFPNPHSHSSFVIYSVAFSTFLRWGGMEWGFSDEWQALMATFALFFNLLFTWQRLWLLCTEKNPKALSYSLTVPPLFLLCSPILLCMFQNAITYKLICVVAIPS